MAVASTYRRQILIFIYIVMYKRKKRSRRVKTRRSSIHKHGRRRRSSRRSSRRSHRRRGRKTMSKLAQKGPSLLDVQPLALETRAKRKVYKRRSTGSKLLKILSGNLQKNTVRWQAVNPYMNTTVAARNNSSKFVGGAYSLRNTGGGILNLAAPLHMYDLTSCNNANGGSIITYNPMRELIFNPSATSTGFLAWNGDTLSGVTNAATSWQSENMAGLNTSVNDVPNRRTFIDNISIKLTCYGSRLYPTTFNIALVKLKHDWMHPETDIPASIPTLNTTRCQFYESIVKPLMSHPIASETFRIPRGLKILQQQSFTIEPPMRTIIGGGTAPGEFPIGPPMEWVGHQKIVDFYFQPNMVAKYDWYESNTDAHPDDKQTAAVNIGTAHCVVPPKDRVYLMVTATNRISGVLDDVYNNHEPSYDIVIKKTYTNIT